MLMTRPLCIFVGHQKHLGVINMNSITTFLKLSLVLFAMMFASVNVNAQDLIVKNDGTTITAFNVDISGSTVYYQLENNEEAAILRIRIDDVLIIRKADGTRIDPSADSWHQQKNTMASNTNAGTRGLDIDNYHGYLLAGGNNVYVAAGSGAEYEKSAVSVLKKGLQAHGVWNVVERVEDAHFILQYVVYTSGADVALILLRTRDNYQRAVFPSKGSYREDSIKDGMLILFYSRTSESISDNVNLAKDFLDGNSCLLGLEKEVDGIWIEALSEEAMPAEYSVARSFYQKDDLPMQGLAKYYGPEDFFERWCHFYKR